MNISKYILASLAISALIAVPLSGVISDYQEQLNLQKLDNASLEIEIEKKETKEQKLEKKIKEIKQDKQKSDKQKQQQIEELKRKLQAKRQRERRVAFTQSVQAQSEPEPEPTPAPAGNGSCEAEIRKYDWDVDWALSVMQKESSGDPTAHNFSHATRDNSYGCFQVNIYGANAQNRPSGEWLSVASNNVQLAYEWYVRDGRTFCGQWPNTC